MGDTIIPVKAFVQKDEADLAAFRSLLPACHQRALDELFIQAELMIAAITMAEHLPRSAALHLAMLVGLGGDLGGAREKILELEHVIKTNAERLAAGPLRQSSSRPSDLVAAGRRW